MSDEGDRMRLGDFEILDELGRGGMGVVYRARQISLGRRVALKVLKGSITLHPGVVDRFRREAAAAARLRHPNIVPIYSTGESEGNHFYAMQLIDGQSLDGALRRMRTEREARGVLGLQESPPPGPVDESLEATVFDETCHPEVPTTRPDSEPAAVAATHLSEGRSYFDSVAGLIAQVADGLEYAHRLGVIHRDIKPGNLILSSEGRIYLTDFGLARLLDEPALTSTGEIMGSPHYMSPEQLNPGRSTPDHRTDIYSLGATLYELLVFRPPFQGETREMVMNSILHRDPTAPRRINRRIPRDLETICLKAMEKRPERRYPSAAAFAEDLRRYTNRFSISARRATVLERTVRWSQRHPSTAGLLVASLVAVVAVGAWWGAERYQVILNQALDAERAARDDLQQAQEAILREKHFGQYVVNISRASHALGLDDGPRARGFLEQIENDAGQRQFKGFEWGYLWRQARQWRGRNIYREAPGWQLSTASFSPDGSMLAVAGSSRSIHLLRGMPAPDRDQVIELVGHSAWVNRVSFSPMGHWLASSSDDGNIRLWDLRETPPAAGPVLTGHLDSVYDIQFIRDGHQLVSCSKDGTLKVWDLASSIATGTLSGHQGCVWSVAWSPGAPDRLASAGEDGTIRLWDLQRREQIWSSDGQGHRDQAISVSISRDGTRLVSGGLGGLVLLWNLRDPGEPTVLGSHPSGVFHVGFSPDGSDVASSSLDKTVRLWKVQRAGRPLILQGHSAQVYQSVFSPDGRGLVSVGKDGTAKLWDLEKEVREEDRWMAGDQRKIWDAEFSPDGSRWAGIASEPGGYTNKVLHLQKASAAGGEAIELNRWSDSVLGVFTRCDFSPDGTLLGSPDAGGRVGLYALPRGERQTSWKAMAEDVRGVCFSPNGEHLAVWGKAPEVRVYRLDDRSEWRVLDAAEKAGRGVLLADYAPDGRFLATVALGANSALIWQTASAEAGEPIRLTAAGTGSIECLAISQDSKSLAIGTLTGNITLWNLAASASQDLGSPHQGRVGALAFLDHGDTLVSASTDFLKFRNLPMGQEVLGVDLLPAYGELTAVGITRLSVARDGSLLLSASGESSVRVWEAAETGPRENRESPNPSSGPAQ